MPSEFNEYLPKESEEFKRWKASRDAGVSGAMEGLTVGEGSTAAAAGGEGGGAAAAGAAAAPSPEKKSGKKKKGGKPEVGVAPVRGGPHPLLQPSVVLNVDSCLRLTGPGLCCVVVTLHLACTQGSQGCCACCAAMTPPPPSCPLPSPPQVVLERNTRNKKKCITTISGLDAFGVKLGEASKLFGKKFASGASVVKNAEGKEHIDVQVGALRVPPPGAGHRAPGGGPGLDECASRRALPLTTRPEVARTREHSRAGPWERAAPWPARHSRRVPAPWYASTPATLAPPPPAPAGRLP